MSESKTKDTAFVSMLIIDAQQRTILSMNEAMKTKDKSLAAKDTIIKLKDELIAKQSKIIQRQEQLIDLKITKVPTSRA